jgi:hypothetical protein
MTDEKKEEIRKKQKEKWFDVWFAIEAVSMDKGTLENALKTHIEKLSAAKNTYVYDVKYHELKDIDNPVKGVEKAHTQVADVKLFVKDLLSLVNIIMLYGPSAIEIIGPDRKEIHLEEVQRIANTIAGIMHQFAAAGVGGMIIKPGD